MARTTTATPRADAPAWYAKPDEVPLGDIVDATARFTAAATRQGVVDQGTLGHMLHNYKLWRAGWSGMGNAARYRTNACLTHAAAIELALRLCACAHDWERAEEWSNVNPVLGTGERGFVQVCRKCGERKHQITWRKNYSGD